MMDDSSILNQIFIFLADTLTQCIEWINQLLSSLGAWGIILSVFILFCIFRFFVLPIVGKTSTAGSDRVRASRHLPDNEVKK